jgi:hypothetical protein
MRARIKKYSSPILQILRDRPGFWRELKRGKETGKMIRSLIGFIILSGAVYGAVLAGWRSPLLSLYVAVKLPILLLGTTGLVTVLNWLLATIFKSGVTFRQVLAITYGSMGVAGWILLGLVPVTGFFTFAVAPSGSDPQTLRLAHNCLLLTHISVIALAGMGGNRALRQGLAAVVNPACRPGKLYWSWIFSFAFVGCQLSWILRPFVGSPFYPVVFLRPDCLERNFYEFVFSEVIPYVLKTGG